MHDKRNFALFVLFVVVVFVGALLIETHLDLGPWLDAGFPQ